VKRNSVLSIAFLTLDIFYLKNNIYLQLQDNFFRGFWKSFIHLGCLDRCI